MKTNFIVVAISLIAINFNAFSQTRYFKISGCPESVHNNWQDTMYVVATADPTVINKCLAELSLPPNSRTLFPSGVALQGSGGYNKNATHCFNWHLKEDEWDLVEIANETCDGCPYSDAELANFPSNPGYFCGWGGRVVAEITDVPNCTLSIKHNFNDETIQLIPNPSSEFVYIQSETQSSTSKEISIYSQTGKLVKYIQVTNDNIPISINDLNSGLYNVFIIDLENIQSPIFHSKLIKI